MQKIMPTSINSGLIITKNGKDEISMPFFRRVQAAFCACGEKATCRFFIARIPAVPLPFFAVHPAHFQA